jgi:undecaprenyl-diphosphatase
MQQPGTTTPPAGAAGPAPAQTHRRALFRGAAIVSSGLTVLAVFAILMLLVSGLKPEQFDLPITREVQEIGNLPILNSALESVSLPGYAPWAYLFPLLLAAAWALARWFAESLFMLLAAAGTLSADLVKMVVHRARPSETLVHVVNNYHLDGSSFPSSHVVEYTLVFGFCFYLAATLIKPSAWRTLILAACGLMVVLVGPSRIAMGQHWASDVIGGYLLGFGLLLVIVWAYRGWEQRVAVRQQKSAPAPAAAQSR